jgi:hypothetical protein
MANPVGFWHRETGDEIKICGSIVQTGVVGVSPAIAVNTGTGFTVGLTGVGDYLLTFTGAASQMISGKAICQITANTVDMEPQFGAFTAGGAGAATLQILAKTAGADTEVPQNDIIHFEVTLYGECLAT